jgi:hypothetical protein
MIKRMVFLSVLVCSLLLGGCSPAVSPTPIQAEASPTIDPCLPEYAHVLTQRVNDHMREFDDASTLASNLTVDQLPASVADLQRIRREAQDEPVPSCLGKLKDLQLAHMNSVINVFLEMLNGVPAQDLQTGVSTARRLHDDYLLEMAQVLGLQVVTQTPAAIPEAFLNTPAAPGVASVINPSTMELKLRLAPDLASPVVATLAANASAPLLGKSADGLWLQLQLPGSSTEKAWVLLEMVTLTTSLDTLPVVTP